MILEIGVGLVIMTIVYKFQSKGGTNGGGGGDDVGDRGGILEGDSASQSTKIFLFLVGDHNRLELFLPHGLKLFHGGSVLNIIRPCLLKILSKWLGPSFGKARSGPFIKNQFIMHF